MIEKLPSGETFDLAVRDGKTGFVFFNIEGNLYDYDANAQSLNITEGRLLISKEFAQKLGHPLESGSVIGRISATATMQPIEITQVVNGEAKSAVLPPLRAAPGVPLLVPGPDVIVGELSGLAQFGSAGTQVGLAVGTDSCNAGQQPLHWFALPDNDHPTIPQNLYRMSGGANNTERFEQVGQSSVKHAFTALQLNACNFGCQPSGTGTLLGPGCSDPYSAGLNAGPNLGSRAWINPFTGFFPRGDSQTPPNNHTGHAHTGTSHRVLVEVNDLNTTLNPGATYFTEAQYVTKHEYDWCQTHPGECNQYNNASYRQFSVTGITNFTFSPVGSTVRTQPAIMAWTGATVNQIQPDPGNDGIFFVGYKVTGPTNGVWHYEYAVYNQNLDRGIQSFEVLFPAFPAPLNNVGFHAPPQHPGWLNDGTFMDQGYSSNPWTFTLNPPPPFPNSAMWNCETFAQNQNANAIRWGTLYNFRFDSSAPPRLHSEHRLLQDRLAYFSGDPGAFMTDTTPTPTPSPTPTPPTLPDTNGYTYTYADTGADHAQCARLQSAGAADRGSLLEWSDLEQHRHLPQRRVHCHGPQHSWFLYRSHRRPWWWDLHV